MSAIRSLSGVEQTCVSCIGFLIRHRRELSSPRGTSSCEEVGYNNIMHAAALRPDTFSTMRRLPGARSVGSASRFARKKLVTTTYAYDNNGNQPPPATSRRGTWASFLLQLRPRKLVPTFGFFHVFRDFRSLCGRQSLIAGEFVLHLAALLRSVCWRVPSEPRALAAGQGQRGGKQGTDEPKPSPEPLGFHSRTSSTVASSDCGT